MVKYILIYTALLTEIDLGSWAGEAQVTYLYIYILID